MKTRTLISATVLFMALKLSAQTCTTIDEVRSTPERCTLNEIIRLSEQNASSASTKAKQAAEAGTTNEVANTNRPTTQPDPFAARLHASYQDFLTPLSLAINDIAESEDGRALIVRFNPFREPPFVAGLTVTAAKPELNTMLRNAIPEAARDGAISRLNEEMEDLDDLTFAASFSFETSDCPVTQKGTCWGRNPKSYSDLLSTTYLELAAPGLGTASSAADLAARDLRLAARAAGTNLNSQLTGVMDTDVRQRLISMARDVVAKDLAENVQFLEFLDKQGVDQLVALLDNQPQFAFSATLHERNVLAGPQEMAYTFEFHVGRRNLNTVKKNCAGDADAIARCISDKVQSAKASGDDFSDKFVLSASYKDIDRYRVALDDVGDIAGFDPLDIARHRELSAKLQWGRRLKMMVADQHPRFDVNAEGIRITDAASDRKKNDWIGTATLTIPVMKNMSVPLSLKYGNRRELLGDVDDELSAHFGISYRLPWDMSQQ